jgi:hypothetical protein
MERAACYCVRAGTTQQHRRLKPQIGRRAAPPNEKTEPNRGHMTNEEKLKALPAAPESAPFKLAQITSVNHKPHPYVIGSRHVVHASDNFGGMLGESAIEHGERKGIHCAHPGCTTAFKNHTSDLVCFIEVSREYPELKNVPGLQEYLKSIADKATELHIDGFAFTKAKA